MTSVRTLTIDDVRVPRFIYGTAWKEEATERLTTLALAEGFRGIDTANQRRHYYEEGVGRAIAAALSKGLVRRNDLFVQTKFTFRAGQDHRLPYDPVAPVASQVEQSFAGSLAQLGVDVIDSYILHGPTLREGLSDADWEAWRAMEEIHASGRSRLLGISNVSLEQLQALCAAARVRPHFVQNRCYAALGWDREVRRYCTAEGVTYQGFSLLTANRGVLNHRELARIANRHGASTAQVIFCFALRIGIVPLTGTTSARHMREDLAAFDIELSLADLVRIEELGLP